MAASEPELVLSDLPAVRFTEDYPLPMNTEILESSENSMKRPATPPFIIPQFARPLETDQVIQERQALEIWIRTNKPLGDWMLRFNCLLALLSVEIKSGREEWINKSITIAATHDRGERFAKLLRRWHKNWVEFRIPPPEPRKGKHMTRHSLFQDEGVSFQFSNNFKFALEISMANNLFSQCLKYDN